MYFCSRRREKWYAHRLKSVSRPHGCISKRVSKANGEMDKEDVVDLAISHAGEPRGELNKHSVSTREYKLLLHTKRVERDGKPLLRIIWVSS